MLERTQVPDDLGAHLQLLHELSPQRSDQTLAVLHVPAGEKGVAGSVKVGQEQKAVVEDDGAGQQVKR